MNCIFCKNPYSYISIYKDFYCLSCTSRQYFNASNELEVSSFYFSYNNNHYRIINRHYNDTTLISKVVDKANKPIYYPYHNMTYKSIFTSNKLLNLTPQNINTKINVILAFI